MKDKLIGVAAIALLIIGVNFIAMSWWLAQVLGYYLLLIDGFFAICAIVLVGLLKRTQVN
jgi:hypothetical protein